MAYSDSFPATRPVFQADFANGGRVDPRITFSRSDTPPTYAAPSAVHYWSNEKHLSSENLLLQSSNFITSWFPNGINGTPTGGQADPAGGTDGFTVVEDSAVGAIHRIFQTANASGDLAFTVYAKQNSGTRYLTLTLFNANNNWSGATFDLAGGSPATGSGSSSVFTSVSATQTASGNGYYKCTLKATGALAGTAYIYLGSSTAAPAGTYGSVPYTGDGTSSLDIAFASLTTTGASDYQPTTTQIHREYAPTLKSVSTAGQPRFEYSPTDSASMGLLVEGSSTQLLTYSSDMTNVAWTENGVTASAEAIGPDGTLSAVAVREDTGTSTHLIRQSVTLNGTAATFSVYAKILGNARRLVIREDAQTGSAAVFDLTTGTVASEVAGGTGTITPVGNGWYRCTMLCAPSSGSRLCSFWVVSNTATNYETTTGDGYSGLLLAMPQAEQQSFSSSWISSTSSTVTRASDSASAVTADIGYTGGPVSMQVDFRANVVLGKTHRIAGIENTRGVLRPYISAGGDVKMFGDVGGTTVIDTSIKTDITANTDYSVALRWDTNDYRGALDGTLGNADTTCPLPDFEGATLYVGTQSSSGFELDGHVKRLAIYPALTDTNLQALTK